MCPPFVCGTNLGWTGLLTLALMINVLWWVHQDARQFFDRCKKWEEGEALPRAMLHTMVASLVDDVHIQMSFTCPVAEFLGPDTSMTAGTRVKRAEGTRGTPGWQPTWNPSIPPICLPCVNKLNRFYPFHEYLIILQKGKSEVPRRINSLQLCHIWPPREMH